MTSHLDTSKIRKVFWTLSISTTKGKTEPLDLGDIGRKRKVPKKYFIFNDWLGHHNTEREVRDTLRKHYDIIGLTKKEGEELKLAKTEFFYSNHKDADEKLNFHKVSLVPVTEVDGDATLVNITIHLKDNLIFGLPASRGNFAIRTVNDVKNAANSGPVQNPGVSNPQLSPSFYAPVENWTRPENDHATKLYADIKEEAKQRGKTWDWADPANHPITPQDELFAHALSVPLLPKGASTAETSAEPISEEEDEI